MKSIDSKVKELKEKIDNFKIVELDRGYVFSEQIKNKLVKIYGIRNLLICSSTDAYHIRRA